jgi:multimeric flavodoxin WrbA
VSVSIMRKNGVEVDQFRSVDHDIATGIHPDMREHGWEVDEWPNLFLRVMAADVLVIGGPIWLGDNSSETKKVHRAALRTFGRAQRPGSVALLRKGRRVPDHRQRGWHQALRVQRALQLQHVGYTIPPQADAGWIGEAGPGPSYGDELPDGTRVGLDNEFTNRNTTFMTWNLLHAASLLREAGGFPAFGNQREEWDAGAQI